jgi:hypothetical protein
MSVFKTVVITLSVSTLLVWNLALTLGFSGVAGRLEVVSQQNTQLIAHSQEQDSTIATLIDVQVEDHKQLHSDTATEDAIIKKLNEVIVAINEDRTPSTPSPSKEDNSIARGR